MASLILLGKRTECSQILIQILLSPTSVITLFLYGQLQIVWTSLVRTQNFSLPHVHNSRLNLRCWFLNKRCSALTYYWLNPWQLLHESFVHFSLWKCQHSISKLMTVVNCSSSEDNNNLMHQKTRTWKYEQTPKKIPWSLRNFWSALVFTLQRVKLI